MHGFTLFLALFSLPAFAGAPADPSAALQANDEQCAMVAIANAKGIKISPNDEALRKCEQASKDVCKDTKSLLGNTINRGKMKDCKGEAVKVASFECTPMGGTQVVTSVGGASSWKNYTCNGARFAASNMDRCNDDCNRHFR